MNYLTQDTTLLIGDRESIENLSQKEHASVLVISDSHGSWFNLYAILKECGSKCDALIFCGDGITDITQILSQSISDTEIAECIPPVIAVVRGNNDTDMYPLQNKEYSPDNGKPFYTQIKVPAVQNIRIAGHDVFISHGHKYSLYRGTDTLLNIAENSESSAAFYGHTHVAIGEISTKGILILNPGSCSRPRMGQPNSFAIVEFKKNKNIEDFVFYNLAGSKIKPYIPEGKMLLW